MQSLSIMGVNISVTDIDRVMRLIYENRDEWRGRYICVSNVHTTVMASENEKYRDIQNRAVMALPDGAPLSAFCRSHGFPKAERVAGPDLFKRMLASGQEMPLRHYLYGSTEETLRLLNEKISTAYPSAVICGSMSPPFRELNAKEDASAVEAINAAKPDIVWVGLGAPKQEIWMASHEGRINALMIGVGAAFDYEAGNIKRPPLIVQRLSLEWFYRLLQDPGRLFKRYLVTNTKFMAWTLKQRRA